MAALTKDRNTANRDGSLVAHPVKAGAKLYAGALAVLDGGLLAPARTATGLVAVGPDPGHRGQVREGVPVGVSTSPSHAAVHALGRGWPGQLIMERPAHQATPQRRPGLRSSGREG
jgi:hypothetical protein